MKIMHQIVYGLTAAILIVAGGFGFLLPFGIAPEIASSFDDEGVHIAQEASCAVLALGLLCVWCARNYEQSRAAHIVVTVFLLLIALVHWLDYARDLRDFASPVITSIPATVFIVLLVRRGPEERQSSDLAR